MKPTEVRTMPPVEVRTLRTVYNQAAVGDHQLYKKIRFDEFKLFMRNVILRAEDKERRAKNNETD